MRDRAGTFSHSLHFGAWFNECYIRDHINIMQTSLTLSTVRTLLYFHDAPRQARIHLQGFIKDGALI